jgi:phosphate transport system permease protein
VTLEPLLHATPAIQIHTAAALSAFALGLFLFIATLCLNVVALYVMKTYREKYD